MMVDSGGPTPAAPAVAMASEARVAPPTSAGSPPPTASSRPAPSAPATITLKLTIDPPGAAIAVDGARVQGTELVVQKDAAAHLLRITAPGYLQYDALVAFDESQRLFVQLKRAASPARTGSPAEDRSRTDQGTGRRTGSNDLIDSTNPYE
jgi:hypothetical protein